MLRIVQSARGRVCTSAPAAAFSTSAVNESAVAAAPAAASAIPRIPAPTEQYPGGRSPTQLIFDVLKTGPKTRKQIYYAINRGAPTAEALAAAAPADAAGKKAKALAEQPHVYPTGILRNPTHLRKLLQGLLAGNRLWTRPLSSVEARLGDQEKEAIEAISRDHPHASALAAASASKSKSGASWVYVLRDWADAGFAAKGPAKQAQYIAKMERRRERKQAALEAAIEGGSQMAAALGKVMSVSRRVRYKREKAAKLEKFEQTVNEATVKYRESVLTPQPPTEAQLASDEAYVSLLRALKPKITESRLAAALEARKLTDQEYSLQMRSENPKLREDALKASLAERAKWVRWVEKRSNLDATGFGAHLRNANPDITQDQIDALLHQRDQALAKLNQIQ